MRLQVRYESAEMGMDDEHWALNIMSKLAKHKPVKMKEREEAVFRALEIPQPHRVCNPSRIFLAKIATGAAFIRFFLSSRVYSCLIENVWYLTWEENDQS